MVTFEGIEKRKKNIDACLQTYQIKNLEEAEAICASRGINVAEIVKNVQPICFENAVWAYTLGTAIALKQNSKSACEAASNIGIGLQAFCVPGSVADDRKVGLGHGNLAAMLLSEDVT